MQDMSFARRIKQAREAKGLSQTQLAKLLGVTRNAVSMWEKVKPKKKPVYPKSETMQQAAVILDVGHDWLATGRGGQSSPQVSGLPIVGTVAAGIWFEIVENQDQEVRRVPVAPVPEYPPEAQFALQIQGNSVNRIARDGTIVVVVDIAIAGIEPRPGDLVWVERRDGQRVEATVKRLRKGAGGLELWPESDDPSHQQKLTLKPRKGEAEVTIRGIVIYTLNPIPRGA